MASDDQAYQNNDRELWRQVPDDYYSPSIHVTEHGAIGINVAGSVYVKSVEEWHKLAGGRINALTAERAGASDYNRCGVATCSRLILKGNKCPVHGESGTPIDPLTNVNEAAEAWAKEQPITAHNFSKNHLIDVLQAFAAGAEWMAERASVICESEAQAYAQGVQKAFSEGQFDPAIVVRAMVGGCRQCATSIRKWWNNAK